MRQFYSCRSICLIESIILLLAAATAARCADPVDDAQQALGLERLQRYAQAIEHFNKAITKEPHKSYLRIHRANCAVELSQYSLAIDDLSEILKQSPFDFKIYTNRGLVYAKSGQYKKAVADFTKALSIHRNFPDALLSRALAYEALHEIDLAKKDRAQLHEESMVRLREAKKAMSHKSVPEAMEDFAKAIKLDEKNPDIYLDRGNVYKDLGQFEAAIKDFKQAVACDGKSLDAHFGLGLSYLSTSQQDKALDSLKQVLKIDPHDRSAHGLLAQIYEGRKDFPAAIKELTQQMGYSQDGRVLFKRAQLYRQLKQFDSALADYTTLSKRFPNDADAHRYRGEVLAALGKYAGAADEFSTAIQIDPETAVIYKERAQAYEKLGKSDLAAKDLKTAGQLP